MHEGDKTAVCLHVTFCSKGINFLSTVCLQGLTFVELTRTCTMMRWGDTFRLVLVRSTSSCRLGEHVIGIDCSAKLAMYTRTLRVMGASHFCFAAALLHAQSPLKSYIKSKSVGEYNEITNFLGDSLSTLYSSMLVMVHHNTLILKPGCQTWGGAHGR